MFRRYALAALTFAAVACGSDDTTDNSGSDKDSGAAAAADSGAAPVVITAGKVTNTGEACTSATDCKGKGATCLTTQTLAVGGTIKFAGGYCSAQCVDDTECTGGGTGGGSCPFANLVNGSNQLTAAAGPLLKPISVCLAPCTTDADCRGAGYKCDTVASQLTGALPAGLEAISGLLTSTLPTTKSCISTDITLPDAGTPAATDAGATDGGATDAGTTTDAGATDAGATDAGATDAGVDAGPDAA